jgi:hypothetical protein
MAAIMPTMQALCCPNLTRRRAFPHDSAASQMQIGRHRVRVSAPALSNSHLPDHSQWRDGLRYWSASRGDTRGLVGHQIHAQLFSKRQSNGDDGTNAADPNDTNVYA